MSDPDLIKLYSSKILALAAEIPHLERLENPDATCQKRSPLCGSVVTVDICVEDGKITRFGQDVKACALGQSAASVVGSVIIGRDIEEVGKARSELENMLKSDGPPPSAPFDGFEVLLPAREYKNRHSSIMLCINAVYEAMESLG